MQLMLELWNVAYVAREWHSEDATPNIKKQPRLPRPRHLQSMRLVNPDAGIQHITCKCGARQSVCILLN